MQTKEAITQHTQHTMKVGINTPPFVCCEICTDPVNMHPRSQAIPPPVFDHLQL